MSVVSESRTAAARRAAPRQPVPDARTLRVLSRFTYGWTPALQAEVEAGGGLDPWLERQLSGRVPDTFYRRSQRWWPSLRRTPQELARRNDEGIESFWEVDCDYQRWALVRRIHGERQLQEMVAEVWEHHFHVPCVGDDTAPYRADYGQRLRAGALGRFADLLHTAVTHPALGVYLDNAWSHKRDPNENLGRELLELHTVGVGAYTEADVLASARILTGYRVDTWDSWRAFYDPRWHATGPVRVLDFTDPNAERDGRPLVRRYLDHLARRPETARRVAHRLAVRFVADEPPEALVSRLAKVYLASDTAIAPVLRALLASPELHEAGPKVRTPSDDVVATYRALGIVVQPPRNEDSAAETMLWQAEQVGQVPLGWPRPDGMPDTAAAWATPTRWLASLDVHYGCAGQWWPGEGATFRSHESWLPLRAGQKKVRFDLLVDHLSRSIHGREATPGLLEACCTAVDCRPEERIGRRHPLLRWNMPRLLTVLLDSPSHMYR